MTINERNTRVFQGKLIDTTDINIVLRPGELSTDLTTLTLYVHDGVTPGGLPLSHGAQGPTGLSAYQVAVNNGFYGTEAQWLASLVGPQGPAGQQGSGGSGGGTGTNYGIVTSSTEIVIATDYLGQQSGLLGHILDIPLNTLNQQITSGWRVIFADGQTTATVASAYTNGDHITLNLTVPGGSLFVQPAYPITVIGTTTLGATATNVVIPGYGLVLNSDGTLSVNSATIQGLLPIYEISGNPGITTIDNNLAVQGVVAATALTVSNFISFPDGTHQSTAALSGSLGFGLQRNNDGTISINSTTIQTLLPILEISQNNTSTTVIDNNTVVQGLLGAHALTVTNAIYFPDGTYMTTAAFGSGNGGSGATGWELTSSTQVVSLDSSGTLHTPLLIPKSFTAVLVPVYGFAPGYNPPGPTGGDAWSYEVHFVVSQDGTVETQIDSPVWASNPGYKNGDSWTFHEADHGIPGYTFTLALSDIAYPGPAGWTANVLASEPPEYPSTVKSLGAVKLSANDKNWIFAPGGNLVFPDSSIQKSATNIIQSATTPETISTSTLWYDTVGGRSYVYYDSGWVDASPMPVVDTTQLTNNGYSLSLDSAGIVNLPTFSGSPSIAIVQTASAGISLNVNGTYFNFNQNGTLTLPGDLHGAEIFESSPDGPISAGHQLNITPASNATDKKFEFTIHQNSSGVFQNAALQLPTSENNKQVYLSFPGNDSGDSSSSIVSLWNQNTNSGPSDFNNAFNILANGKDIKLTAEDSIGGLSTWTFGTDGSLTWPDTSVQTTAFTASSYINTADLKAIITTCTNFTEFKNAILGL